MFSAMCHAEFWREHPGNWFLRIHRKRSSLLMKKMCLWTQRSLHQLYASPIIMLFWLQEKIFIISPTVSKRYMACIHRENTRIQEKCISKCIRFIPIWKMFRWNRKYWLRKIQIPVMIFFMLSQKKNIWNAWAQKENLIFTLSWTDWSKKKSVSLLTVPR